MSYKVALVCDNGKFFVNPKDFPTISDALDCMIKTQQLLDFNAKMAIMNRNDKIILTKGVSIK